MPRGAPNGAWSLPETACGNVLFAGGARFREEDFWAVRIADRKYNLNRCPPDAGVLQYFLPAQLKEFQHRLAGTI